MDRKTWKLRIKEWREAEELSQTDLAEKSGVTRQTIIKLESGRIRYPQRHTLESLADALGVTPERLERSPSQRPDD